MNRVADDHVEAVEHRKHENHGEGGDTHAHNRNPCHDVDEVVTFLCEKITLRYE